VSAIREGPVQRRSKVFGLGAEEQGFVAEVDFQSRLASLLLRWKTADTVFVMLSFSVWAGGIHLRLSCPCSVLPQFIEPTIYRTDNLSNRQFIERQIVEPTIYRTRQFIERQCLEGEFTAVYRKTVYRKDSVSNRQFIETTYLT